ncbi:MAG TPA: hypothetical protein VJA82_05730 [Sediminibacterium sp.]|uniref:hypothetical protein n=1 Tax=Sediminibacterium sp. TaxID=1917865 RepID=UPI0025F227EE|nr:hypothetical protein [Sediminibacterium sp.]MBT9483492.1 hypothetical protein [Sediminibacterium sp.]HLD52780.1 hypothetical protein [Sediminibacterium sp.]
MKSKFQQSYIPLIILFGVVNTICFLFSDTLKIKQIDPIMVAGANTLLFVICSISIRSQIKSANNTNPHAMVRGVMGSVVLKLFVLGTAAFIYLYNVGEAQSVNGIFVSMGLYIVYTWLEVKMAMQIKPTKKDGSN